MLLTIHSSLEKQKPLDKCLRHINMKTAIIKSVLIHKNIIHYTPVNGASTSTTLNSLNIGMTPTR